MQLFVYAGVYVFGERFALLCGAHKLLMCPLNPLSILLASWSWAFSFCHLFTSIWFQSYPSAFLTASWLQPLSIWFQSHPSAFLTASWGQIVRVDSRMKLAHTYIPRVWDVWSTKQGGHDVPFRESRSWQGIARVWRPGMACTICRTSCHIPLLWIS